MLLNRRRLIPVIIVALTALSGHILSGQGYVLTYYNSKTGIGHDNVRTIVADSSGFIWMATWDVPHYAACRENFSNYAAAKIAAEAGCPWVITEDLS